ncbi:MAG: hypothetical protein H6R00_4138 [Proteobacteria bacterium]|nr:hypothetical protein [Pseudomonadota bacterium]
MPPLRPFLPEVLRLRAGRQKAFGPFFGPLVSAPNDRLAWTRGEPSWFHSSNKVRLLPALWHAARL